MQPASKGAAAQCPKCSGLELKKLSQKEHPAPEFLRDGSPRLTTVYECAACGTVFSEAR